MPPSLPMMSKSAQQSHLGDVGRSPSISATKYFSASTSDSSCAQPTKTTRLSSCERGDEKRIVPVRLQRFLARGGVASRRGSESLISAGRVQVNGVVVTELGRRVHPLWDEVCVDGRQVSWDSDPVVVMLHKPSGYLSTMADPYKRSTVASLIPQSEYPGLFPVGRLDADTTGLLLFTTDGNLGHALLHPRYHVDKRYLALLQSKPTSSELAHLERGIDLEDGMTAPAKVKLFDGAKQNTVWQLSGAKRFSTEAACCVEIVLHEGRKHQVKRMFLAIGHPVCALHRVSFGPLVLGDLAEGSCRVLTDEEYRALRATAHRAAANE